MDYAHIQHTNTSAVAVGRRILIALHLVSHTWYMIPCRFVYISTNSITYIITGTNYIFVHSSQTQMTAPIKLAIETFLCTNISDQSKSHQSQNKLFTNSFMRYTIANCHVTLFVCEYVEYLLTDNLISIQLRCCGPK